MALTTQRNVCKMNFKGDIGAGELSLSIRRDVVNGNFGEKPGSGIIKC